MTVTWLGSMFGAMCAASLFVSFSHDFGARSPHGAPASVANAAMPDPNCALHESINIITLNVQCPTGNGNCVDVTITGTTAGASLGCPVSCRGTKYDIRVTRNVCPGVSCCTGDIDVDQTGQPTQKLGVPPASVTLSIGGDMPGCGNAVTDTLWIHCHLGNDLFKANLVIMCDAC